MMKIVLISGQNHKGSTYHIARAVADKVNGENGEADEIKEFFLPRDFSSFCTGCTTCFTKDEKLCPHYKQIEPLTNALLQADLIILSSPVYVYHATGAMKAFLDHYGYLWMIHRPDESMFKKQAVCVATAAGAGMKSTIKDMADSLFFWGVPKKYGIGLAVKATRWDQISEKTMVKINRKVSTTAARIKRNHGRVKPGLKTKAFFFMMHLLQKNGWNEADVKYWHEKDWTGSKRPWKK